MTVPAIDIRIWHEHLAELDTVKAPAIRLPELPPLTPHIAQTALSIMAQTGETPCAFFDRLVLKEEYERSGGEI